MENSDQRYKSNLYRPRAVNFNGMVKPFIDMVEEKKLVDGNCVRIDKVT